MQEDCKVGYSIQVSSHLDCFLDYMFAVALMVISWYGWGATPFSISHLAIFSCLSLFGHCLALQYFLDSYLRILVQKLYLVCPEFSIYYVLQHSVIRSFSLDSQSTLCS